MCKVPFRAAACVPHQFLCTQPVYAACVRSVAACVRSSALDGALPRPAKPHTMHPAKISQLSQP